MTSTAAPWGRTGSRIATEGTTAGTRRSTGAAMTHVQRQERQRPRRQARDHPQAPAQDVPGEDVSLQLRHRSDPAALPRKAWVLYRGAGQGTQMRGMLACLL